jgi:hypothetical protein
MQLRRSVAGVVMTALTVGFLALGAPVASASASKESEFVSKINAERRERGKGALTVKSDLVAAARRHSARMAAKGDIWHNDNLGNEIDGWTVLGENVGMGPTVDSLHEAFMNSQGHRHNILLSDYNQVGIGVVVDNGTIYVTEVFARRADSTPSDGGSGDSNDDPGTVTAQAPAARAVSEPGGSALQPPIQRPRTIAQLVRVIQLDALE